MGPTSSLAVQLAFMGIFALNALVTLIFLVRQISFSIVAIGLPRTNPFSRIQMKEWPTVTVLIVVNDRSRDRTGPILDAYVAGSDGRVRAIHRPE